MKIILSRKGFDSSAGGCASPLFADGRLLSLPIPDRQSPIRYGDLRFLQRPHHNLLRDLSKGTLSKKQGAHLDPDLHRDALDRLDGWQPAFGQIGASQGHLSGMGVGPGDLFLFFGWFRLVEQYRSTWRFVPKAPDLHIFHGWLSIGDILQPNSVKDRLAPGLGHHPHCHGERGSLNRLYLAAGTLQLPDTAIKLAGSGVFPQLHPELVLTQPGMSRSVWHLPAWFHPEGRASSLSYHHKIKRWQKTPTGTQLRSAYRGQDFVLDGDHYPEALGWAASLIRDHGQPSNSTRVS